VAATAFADALAVPAQPTVVALSLENSSIVSDEEILSLFKPALGEIYSKATVNRSLSLLSHVSGIETVRVLYREQEMGVSLRLVVKPVSLIRSIDLEGLDALEESDVEVSLYTRVDEPAYPPFLEQDVDYMVERLREIGYLDAKVTTAVSQSKKANWVNVTFDVDEGAPTRIAALGDMGQSSELGEEKVLYELGLRVGSIASLPRLREGVRELEQYCWAAGYPEARVLGERFDHSSGSTLLHLPLSLGERTSFEVTGAPEWQGSKLKELLESRYGEELDEDWLVHASRDLRDALVDEGYMNASVNSRVEKGEERRRVIFEVTPEKRVHLEAVIFEHVQALDVDDVEEVMDSLQTGFFGGAPLFKREVLDADLGRIRQHYVAEGFLTAKVWVKELLIMPDGATTVVIGLEEGPRFYYGKIEIAIDTDAIDAETAATVAAVNFGQPASPGALEKARINLLAEMSKRGYINAGVKVMATPAAEGRRVDVVIEMTSGSRKSFGAIVVSGNARTETKVILRELDFQSGEPWNPAKILLSRRELFRLGFFQEVKIEPLGSVWPDRTQDIIVRVREQNAGYLDYGFGYGTEERFKAFFEIGHSNISGTGRSLSLRLSGDATGSSYALNFREPWVFDFPMDLRVSLLNRREEREAYKLDSTALQVALDREFSDAIRGSLIYTLEDNELTGVEPGAVLADEDVEPYRVSAIGPLVVFDTRDDPFNPRWGFYHNARAEWARSEIGSDLEYGRYTGFASVYASYKKLTLALLARGGLIEYYGITNELPVNKRFFLGGRTTVRGFERDQIGPKAADGSVIGGDVMINLKAELRFPIRGDIGGALFWDAGQAWNKSENSYSWESLRHGVGFGLRYNTPVGPLALDIGFKLDKEDGEAGTQWHFTIGNAF
jgi:outer membrane protein insertion porin family